ncbi:MAG: helix-turn-helix domain-containing protein [Lachnospiraceae bacterium]|nr:helix-turn-helix domain-containing protein [Lachnospiraceae bacterium]
MGIGEKLKNFRMSAGMTQEQIAEEINVSRQTISNWENGKSLPDVISLIKISDFYQISLDDLLKGDGKMMDKIKMDTDTVKSNQTMMNLGWAILIFSFVFSVWNNYHGNNPFLQFISAAAPWVMLGVGIACTVESILNKKKD